MHITILHFAIWLIILFAAGCIVTTFVIRNNTDLILKWANKIIDTKKAVVNGVNTIVKVVKS